MFANILSKYGWGLREKRVIRYVLGSLIAMAIAMAFAWPLSFVVPVLILGMLKPGSAAPTIKSSANFVIVITLACATGLMISQFLTPYPVVHMVLLALLFLHLFYSDASELNAELKTWVMIAALLIPMLGLNHQGIAFMVAINLWYAAILTVVINGFVYMLFPEPESNNVLNANLAPPKTKKQRYQEAVEGLIVTMPMVIAFYVFNWTSDALVLIFVAILASNPALVQSFAVGKAMILGNLLGGLSAIVMYEVLVSIPQYYFLIILMLLFGLFFADRLFSDKKAAPLYGMAFSTLIVIIGSATTSDADAGDKVWIRVIQIATAVIYTVMAYRFVILWKQGSWKISRK